MDYYATSLQRHGLLCIFRAYDPSNCACLDAGAFSMLVQDLLLLHSGVRVNAQQAEERATAIAAKFCGSITTTIDLGAFILFDHGFGVSAAHF